MIRFVLEPPITGNERLAAFRSQCAAVGKLESEAARDLGGSYYHVMMVIKGYRRSRPVEAKFAAFVGLPAEELFADRVQAHV